jgi:hypothetical protein
LTQPLPWLAAAGLAIFAVFFLAPFRTPADDPDPSRLAFTGTTERPLNWVEMCLGKDWGGRLSLRHRPAPVSTIRLDNPVWHFIVDVADEGRLRRLRAYSRHGEPFTPRQIEALDGCLTGHAPALGDPRNR